jgi:two-component system, response regulator, stage 0 sporulation protein A
VEKPSVLLADDNEATCTLIRALLQSEFSIDIVGDGAEAIRRLRGRHYSAILLDLRMPLVDGYGVLDHLTSERPELLPRVVVVTAAITPR